MPPSLGLWGGGFPVFWGPWTAPRRMLFCPPLAKARAQLPALQTWAWEGLLRPSSSGSAQPGELIHFSPKSLHICGTRVCLLRKISFRAEGWQRPCRVPTLHPLPQTAAQVL